MSFSYGGISLMLHAGWVTGTDLDGDGNEDWMDDSAILWPSYEEWWASASAAGGYLAGNDQDSDGNEDWIDLSGRRWKSCGEWQGFETWAAFRGLDISRPNLPDEDDDGDGLTNYQEYLAGTDPLKWDTDGGGKSDGE